MIVCIGEVLRPEELERLRSLAAAGRFVDGRATAGWAAATVKNNLQLAADDPGHAEISEVALSALTRNEVVAAVGLPRNVSRLMVSRCDPGMGYGAHVDNALMGDPPLRTDLAFTLFLNDPADYNGGELVIDDAQGEQSIKLEAGALVLYPATTTHRVATVSRGARLVVVGWIQSLVRDPRVREMLFDLHQARLALFREEGKSPAFDAVAKVYSNLLRMYAEP